MEKEKTFFEFAAQVGLTKHIGSVDATDELVQLCQISKDSYVLDVGSGVGQTPCYLAEKYNCRVVGVDIVPKMIERSNQRARKTGVADLVDFRVADAQELPFDNETFDIVITESATAFPEDKQKAVLEYARVLKPGGYVGLNESTWLKFPPPPDIVAWVQQDIGSTVEPLTSEGWQNLLTNAGLKITDVRIKSIETQDETKGILHRYGTIGMLGVMGRMLLLYLRNPIYRKFVKDVSTGGIIPENIHDYFGYGLFIARK